MGRSPDSEFVRKEKRAATKSFIAAVEEGTSDGPTKIATKLEIGGVDGDNTWIAYRRDENSWWRYSTLKIYIERARQAKYITSEIAVQLLLMIPSDEPTEVTKPELGEHKFDATRLLFLDVEKTIAQLFQQIDSLKPRIRYGHERGESIHYDHVCLMLLEPVQAFIEEKLQNVVGEEMRLAAEFGNAKYREIFPVESNQSISAWDIGYFPEWWTKPMPTKDEISALRSSLEKLFLYELNGRKLD